MESEITIRITFQSSTFTIVTGSNPTCTDAALILKGYEETSEYSELARVFSDINKAKWVEDLLLERPKLYKTLTEAQDSDPELYASIETELRDNLGVDPSTEKGKVELGFARATDPGNSLLPDENLKVAIIDNGNISTLFMFYSNMVISLTYSYIWFVSISYNGCALFNIVTYDLV